VSKQDIDINKLKWNTRKRLQFIEIMAFYTGVITRSDIAGAFDISDAAATKDLKLYNDLFPGNLIYTQNVFGYIPGPTFKEALADLSPQHTLPVIASNQASFGEPEKQQSIYEINAEHLTLPSRYPDKNTLANITRAIHGGKKLRAEYRSLSDRDSNQTRIIEPHSLADTGLRWHVRAYNTETYDFRDFILSRFIHAEVLNETAESGAAYDEEWTETATIELIPHPNLQKEKQDIVLMDYAAKNGVIEIRVRRAMIGYLLQRLGVDTTRDHELNPNAHQLAIKNRDEIEIFAEWAFQ